MDERRDANQAQVVVRWRMKNGRSGKTARMTRTEAEHLVRELAPRFRTMGFEVG